MLDRSARELLRDGEEGRVSGRKIEDRRRRHAAADTPARRRRWARLEHRAACRVRTRTSPHRRFSYTGYFEGPPPTGSPNGSIWMTDPQWGAAFPTDDGTTMYAAMPTKERLPEFRRDPTAALIAFVADLPDAPPILPRDRSGRRSASLRCPTSCAPPQPQGWRLSATPRSPPTRCSASAAAGPFSRPNGSQTVLRRRWPVREERRTRRPCSAG